MHVILGATGHIGRALCAILAERGAGVLAVSRDAARARRRLPAGVEVAEADIHDARALREVLRRGRRAFLLNPPGDTGSDGEAQERATASAIAEAVAAAGDALEAVVVASTYGARDARGAGDLGTLHAFESAITALPVPAAVIRSAYYMSNWDMALAAARDEGVLHTLFPPGLEIPMVAPRDIAAFAAGLLLSPTPATGMFEVEGPRRETPAAVADAFAAALGRDVRVESTPRDAWTAAFRALGFSPASADSYARMTAITVDDLALPDAPHRGPTRLEDHVSALVARDREEAGTPD